MRPPSTPASEKAIADDAYCSNAGLRREPRRAEEDDDPEAAAVVEAFVGKLRARLLGATAATALVFSNTASSVSSSSSSS